MSGTRIFCKSAELQAVGSTLPEGPGFISGQGLSLQQHFPNIYRECLCCYNNNHHSLVRHRSYWSDVHMYIHLASYGYFTASMQARTHIYDNTTVFFLIRPESKPIVQQPEILPSPCGDTCIYDDVESIKLHSNS